MKVRRAFYITPWTKPLNLIISLFTFSKFSHEEIGFLMGGKWRYFSSTNRDGAKGTRWIDEKPLFRHPGRWVIKEYEVADTHFSEMTERANSIKKLPYDWTGIFGQIIPFYNMQKQSEWYCCEACDYVDTGITRKSNPGSDYRRVIKNHDCKDITL